MTLSGTCVANNVVVAVGAKLIFNGTTYGSFGEASAVAAVRTNLATELATIVKLDTALVLDGVVYQFTANALELGPSGGGGGGDATAANQTTILANIATVAGYIDTEVAAIKAKTDLIPASPASTTNITAGTITTVTTLTNLPTIPTNWITADGIATDAFGSLELAAGAASEIATAVSAAGVEVASFDAAALAQLAALGTINVTGAVTGSGIVNLTQGGDYLTANGRQLQFVNAAGSLPDLTGATPYLVFKNAGTTHSAITGTVITPTGANQRVDFDVSDSVTDLLVATRGEFEVYATLATSGNVVPIESGVLNVTLKLRA